MNATGVPFVLAVSGHRDIHPDDASMVRKQLHALLRLTAAALPHTPLLCLSPLADGADQLFAEQALRLAHAAPGRVRLQVPLPMPLQDYIRAQAGANAADQAAFASRLAPGLAAADGAFQIPAGQDDPAVPAADAPYLRLAAYLAQRADLLVAVWDGQAGPDGPFPRRPGGTLDTVLTRLENHGGPVAHVYARRQASSSEGLPAAGTRGMGGAALAVAGRDAGGRLQVSRLRGRGDWPHGRRWRRVLARAEAALGQLGPHKLALLYQIWRSGRHIERLNRRNASGCR